MHDYFHMHSVESLVSELAPLLWNICDTCVIINFDRSPLLLSWWLGKKATERSASCSSNTEQMSIVKILRYMTFGYRIYDCPIFVCCSFQNGWSALHFASAYGHPSIVELFIKSGAQLDAQTKVHYRQLVGDNVTLNAFTLIDSPQTKI